MAGGDVYKRQVLPIILGNLTGMSIQLGGTSLLIVVGVALDTTRSLDSFMILPSPSRYTAR